MGKLSPKPGIKLKSWDDLDTLLKNDFKQGHNPQVSIDLSEYSMSKEDIIKEASAQGYKVSEVVEGYLLFT